MKKNTLLIIYIIPVALLLWFVASFSVNVPMQDQWELASFFDKLAVGNATFGDFWALHNSHRIVFPRIIIAIIAFSSKWNINYELCLSIGFSMVTFAAIYKLSSNQERKKERDILFHLANILTCLLVFSLVQHENWLWGFQLAWFLVNLCVTLAIFVLNLDNQLLLSQSEESVDIRTAQMQSKQREEEKQEEKKIIDLNEIWYDIKRWCQLKIKPLVLEELKSMTVFKPKLTPIDFRLFIAAICCEIASLSLAQGLLSWLAVIPSVVAVDGSIAQRRKRLLIWMLLFALSCALDSLDYRPKRIFSIFAMWEQPLVALNYFFNLLGSPIVRLPVISALVGLAIFAIFSFFVFYFIKNLIKASFSQMKYSYKERDTASWLSLGLFSVLSALLITAGRVRFGANQAIESSRYTTVSIFLLIAVIQLWQIFDRSKQVEKSMAVKPLYRFFAGMLICIILVNSQQAIAQTSSALLYRQSGKTCLELIYYLDSSNFFDTSPDSCLRILTQKTQLVREGAKILDKISFRKFAKDVDFITNASAVYGYVENPLMMKKPFSVKKSSIVRVTGWAILPNQLEPPKIVLLSYGNKKSFFANAYVNLDSPDVAKALQSNRYSRVRWAVTFSANYLPIDQTEIKAWVYNPVDKQFVQLRGG